MIAQSSSTVSAIVAEDEPVLLGDLQARLQLLWPELAIVGAAANGVDAVALLERLHPQIVFLDIEIPGLNGLEVAQRVATQCHIVFITAYDAHAVAAFDHGVIDYVLKPYDNERLALALKRVRERLSAAPPDVSHLLRELAMASRPREYLRWIKASRGSDVDLIMVGEVSYFEADAKYTTVYTAAGEALIRTPIKELAAELDPNCFWQVHRSRIVNVEHIETVSRNLSGMHIKMRGRPERLRVSDVYRYLFKHM